MKRCYNKNNDRYAAYGGRGIRVCERWHQFGNFLADMGVRPSQAHTVDREYLNDDYSPDNCRWVTNDVQRQNRQETVLITINGETKILADWLRYFGLTHVTYGHRLDRGWSAERALTTPPDPRFRNVRPRGATNSLHILVPTPPSETAGQ